MNFVVNRKGEENLVIFKFTLNIQYKKKAEVQLNVSPACISFRKKDI
jgi:hypothetical protein